MRNEWVTLVMKEVTNPDYGLFQISANNISIQPNPLSYIIPNHLLHFRFIGRLVAYSIIKDLPLEINLTKSFLKHIASNY